MPLKRHVDHRGGFNNLVALDRETLVVAGVRDAIGCGAVGFDAVKHLVLCRIERRPPRLNLTVYPYLPKVFDKALFRNSRERSTRNAEDSHPPLQINPNTALCFR